MAELVSMLIGTVVLYFIYALICEYNALVQKKYQFRFFALRDRLAMLVITGKLEESSWEYKHIVDTLNFHISAVERMSAIRMIEMLVRYHTSPKEDQSVKTLNKRVDDADIIQILVEFMSTTYELIRRNSRAQLFIVHHLVKAIKPKDNASHHIVTNPCDALTAIKCRQSTLQTHLAAV